MQVCGKKVSGQRWRPAAAGGWRCVRRLAGWDVDKFAVGGRWGGSGPDCLWNSTQNLSVRAMHGGCSNSTVLYAPRLHTSRFRSTLSCRQSLASSTAARCNCGPAAGGVGGATVYTDSFTNSNGQPLGPARHQPNTQVSRMQLRPPGTQQQLLHGPQLCSCSRTAAAAARLQPAKLCLPLPRPPRTWFGCVSSLASRRSSSERPSAARPAKPPITLLPMRRTWLRANVKRRVRVKSSGTQSKAAGDAAADAAHLGCEVRVGNKDMKEP